MRNSPNCAKSRPRRGQASFQKYKRVLDKERKARPDPGWQDQTVTAQFKSASSFPGRKSWMSARLFYYMDQLGLTDDEQKKEMIYFVTITSALQSSP